MRSIVPFLLFCALAAPGSAQEGPTNQIHYPLSEELGGLLRAAEAAAKAGRLEQAVEIYRGVLDADRPDGVYQVAPLSAGGADGPRRFVGVTSRALRGLYALPPEGKQLFRAKYDYRAHSALREALAAKDRYRALMRAYELFPVSSHSARMLEAAADVAIEAGAFSRARRALERLAAFHADDVDDPTRLLRKRLLCAVGAGDAEKARSLALELRRRHTGRKVDLGGRAQRVDDLTAEALRVASLRSGRSRSGPPAGTHLVRGDARNRACFDFPRIAIGAPRFSPRVFARPLPAVPLRGGRILPGTLPQGSLPARHLAIAHGDQVFVASADALFVYDLRSGERSRRIFPLPRRPSFRDGNPKVQFGAAFERGIVVAPLVEEVLREQDYKGIPIKVKIPVRKLAGFDVDEWRWRWDHARLLRGTPMERWSFPTPPSAEEGVIYASAWAIEGFVDCNVGAFDARTGEPLWRTWVSSGQVEQTMFGEQAIEPLCVPVAVAYGLVFHCTSFGSMAALDADTGRPEWITEYRQIEVRAPRGYYADTRSLQWENNAPLVEDGVVVVTPLDSPSFYGYDARTGERLWEASRRRYGVEPDMRYLMGASRGRVVVAGGHEVRCLDVRSGKLVWRAALRGRLVAGRGLVAGGAVLVPVDRNEVFAFDLEGGRRLARYGLRSTGNLTISGDALIVTGSGSVSAYELKSSAEGRDF
ncbi:MAG: hypothetical protein D6731_24550 [Planctomycetota bacterium]|nr:MAG: hypothetical protein D6731_24550 [Planctomycetota bacterium]